MLRLGFSVSPRRRLPAAVVAIVLLAGCADRGTLVPPQSISIAPNALSGLATGFKAAAPPKCKDQKSTKEYATVAKEAMKKGGGSLCVPSFGDWGGALQYPQTYGSAPYTVALTSSTKEYSGPSWPPKGSEPPIFNLQLAFNSFPGFYPTLPKGDPLVSIHLVPKKPYTVTLWLNVIIGWSNLGSCYQVAAKSKYGGQLADVGAVFEKQTFLEMDGVLQVSKGKLVTNKCERGN
ncbi:MAG: hypothetical protein WBX23_05695 [Candidatus Cybelea sp.]